MAEIEKVHLRRELSSISWLTGGHLSSPAVQDKTLQSTTPKWGMQRVRRLLRKSTHEVRNSKSCRDIWGEVEETL